MEVKYYGDKIEKSTKAISLCGPTPRNNKVTSWRKKLWIYCKILVMMELYMFRS